MPITVGRLRALLDKYPDTARVLISTTQSCTLNEAHLPTASVNQAGREMELVAINHQRTDDARSHLMNATVTLVIKD
jgi:hypothetical protein